MTIQITKVEDRGFTFTRQTYGRATGWQVGEIEFKRKKDATAYCEFVQLTGLDEDMNAFAKWLHENKPEQFKSLPDTGWY